MKNNLSTLIRNWDQSIKRKNKLKVKLRKIQNSKFKIQNSKFKIQNSKFKIQTFLNSMIILIIKLKIEILIVKL